MFEAHSINAEHKDLIHDIAYDFYGQRMATCSSDQFVKVCMNVKLTSKFQSSLSHLYSLTALSVSGDILTRRQGRLRFVRRYDPMTVPCRTRIKINLT